MDDERVRSAADALLHHLDHAYLLNLASRPDRLRASVRELEAMFGADLVAAKVTVFAAQRPDDSGRFANVGTRGCFESHLAVLRTADAAGHRRIAVIEDDVHFTSGAAAQIGPLTDALAESEWGYAHLGYHDPFAAVPAPVDDTAHWLAFSGEIQGAQLLCVDRSVLRRLIEHLETCADGVLGDDLRGPMPVDGAYNTFRWLNEDVVRLVASPSVAGQRSSRSDITPGRFDRHRVLGPLMSIARAQRERFAPRR
jgi:glycosyl transferase family 25